jgi:hypothetical protein
VCFHNEDALRLCIDETRKVMRMIPYTRALVMLLALDVFTPVAFAAPECQVRVLRPVTDDVGNVWQPGKILPATIMRQQAGQTSFCAHGGSCLPRMVEGKQAVRLIDCRRGPAIGNGDYRLVPR